ncbi:hypothetical protein ACX0GZ_08305 [Sphingomonas aestuarii]
MGMSYFGLSLMLTLVTAITPANARGAECVESPPDRNEIVTHNDLASRQDEHRRIWSDARLVFPEAEQLVLIYAYGGFSGTVRSVVAARDATGRWQVTVVPHLQKSKKVISATLSENDGRLLDALLDAPCLLNEPTERKHRLPPPHPNFYQLDIVKPNYSRSFSRSHSGAGLVESIVRRVLSAISAPP